MDALNYTLKREKRSAPREFWPGDHVFFTVKWGTPLDGTVTKVNRTTDVVTTGPGAQWRVSPTLLKKI